MRVSVNGSRLVFLFGPVMNWRLAQGASRLHPVTAGVGVQEEAGMEDGWIHVQVNWNISLGKHGLNFG